MKDLWGWLLCRILRYHSMALQARNLRQIYPANADPEEALPIGIATLFLFQCCRCGKLESIMLEGDWMDDDDNGGGGGGGNDAPTPTPEDLEKLFQK